MGKPRKSSSKRKPENATRSITPEVFEDKRASNMLSFSKPKYQSVGKDNKTYNRGVDKRRAAGKLVSKKPRTYTEKELGIPKLNSALNPVGVAVKGKKGKKFVDDDKMQLILAEVQQKSQESTASKLERARQLEAIREQKRREMEQREEQQREKLEAKKKEARRPRNVRKKHAAEGGANNESTDSSSSGLRRKRVSFAA